MTIPDDSLPAPSAFDPRDELRRRLRAARRALTTAERESHSARLCERVAGLPSFRAARRVAVFTAFDGEADPAALLTAAPDKQYYLPILPGRAQPMRFAPYRPGAAMRRNRFDILEPDLPEQQYVGPETLDFVLTPLVGFDADGNRLGVGGGFYDRTFAFTRTPALPGRPHPNMLGFAFEIQKLPPGALQPRPWDIRLPAVATEQAYYQPGPA